MRRALALIAIAACAMPSQPYEGHPVLAAIKFEGNQHISGGDLLGKIATTPTSGFFSKTARYYDADLFAIDLKRIVRWYNQKGFYEAKIADVQELRDEAGRVTLVVKIDEGKRAVVKAMDFQGLEDVPKNEASDMDDALPIHPGDAFDEDDYEKAKDVLKEQLREHGFAEAEVNGRVEVAPEDGSAHIWFDCDTGPRYRFGKVTVTGNRQISSSEITFAAGIEKGQLYSPQAIALAQQRVYNLGTFSGVRVQLEPLGDTPVAAVRVNVREAPFQTFRLGLGFSAEQTRWELPRVLLEYTNRSLFGGLRRLELSSTTGYAFVSSPFAYDPSQSGIASTNSAQLTIPNVIIPGLDWITRGEFTREVQSGFHYYDVAGRTGFLYRHGNHSLAPSLNFVRYFDVTVQGADVAQIIGRVGAAGALANECGGSCTLTYPEIRYTYDGRDNAIEPSQGFYFTLGLQQTLKPGSFSYFRVNPDLRVYLPLWKYAVIALRGEYGGMFAEGSSLTPFTQRFFMGGQNDQRGYAPLRQGPKAGANPTCNATGVPSTATPPLATCKPGEVPWATGSVPIGGNSAVLFSAELRIHADYILNHLGIVLFLDASRVQDSPSNPMQGGLEFAPGLGLRYVTSFGPIRLDFGWVANPKDVYTRLVGDPANPAVAATRVSDFCRPNARDCIKEQRWAIHVTLGEAF